MQNLFIEYPKCSTCQKAKKWLQWNNIKFEDRHIIDNNPTEEELPDSFEPKKIIITEKIYSLWLAE